MAHRKIGLLAPPGNIHLEIELPRHLPAHVSLHTTRVYKPDSHVDNRGLAEMTAHIGDAAKLIARTAPDIVVYGCTSGSFIEGATGNARVTEQIQAITGVRAVTAASAIVSALEEVRARRIMLVTPYLPEIVDDEKRFLAEFAIGVVGEHHMARRTSEEIRSVAPDRLLQAVLALRVPKNADAIFISCTNLRSLEIVPRLETAHGIPVITSNQAVLRQIAKHLGIRMLREARLGFLFGGVRERRPAEVGAC